MVSVMVGYCDSEWVGSIYSCNTLQFPACLLMNVNKYSSFEFCLVLSKHEKSSRMVKNRWCTRTHLQRDSAVIVDMSLSSDCDC
jgi:hypothetical protein